MFKKKLCIQKIIFKLEGIKVVELISHNVCVLNEIRRQLQHMFAGYGLG